MSAGFSEDASCQRTGRHMIIMGSRSISITNTQIKSLLWTQSSVTAFYWGTIKRQCNTDVNLREKIRNCSNILFIFDIFGVMLACLFYC